MSVQQEHSTSETATLTTTESGGVYQSLFDKINLTPVSSIQEIDLWQNSETLADASPDERVTAAIHVLLSCLAKSGEDVVKLDKSLLDFHIDDLDQKISKQLDAVMHHPEFQKVESLWRGTWFVVQRTDFRKMSELNCWISAKSICVRISTTPGNHSERFISSYIHSGVRYAGWRTCCLINFQL